MTFIRNSLQKRAKLSRDGTDLAIMLAVCLFVVTVMAGLRWWSSRLKKRPFNAADYMSFVSQLLFYSYAVVTYLILGIGHIGYPISETPSWRRRFTFKCFLYTQLAFAVGMGLAKASVVCVYLRFHPVSRLSILRLASRIILAICLCWSTMAVIGGISGCQPVDYHWNLRNPDGHCINRRAASIAIGVMDIISNTAIALTLALMIPKIDIDKSKKLAIAGVFALGIFGIVTSILRATSILATDFSSFNQEAKMVFVWTVVEWVVAIIVYNALMLGPIFDSILRPKMPERNAQSEGFEMLFHPASHGATYTAKAAAGGFSRTRSYKSDGTQKLERQSNSPEPGEVRIQTEWTIETSRANASLPGSTHMNE